MYNQIKELKRGDLFTETEYGSIVVMMAQEDAKEDDGIWRCLCKTVRGGRLVEYCHNLKADPNRVYEPRIIIFERADGGGSEK